MTANTAGASPTTVAPTANTNTIVAAKGQPLEQPHVSDNNPRWKGYAYLAFASLVCCASTGNVKEKTSEFVVSVAVGSVSFALSMIILLLDRFHGCFESFKFHRARDGKLEGFFLIFFVMWWVFGVWIMTQSGGAGYFALNIYFSSWLSLFASCYTLNDWSGSKDIITIQELTALSATLRGWYCLLFSSLVVMGSGADMHRHLSEDGPKQQASFAVALGLISMIVAFIFILAYYRILSFVPLSGCVELSVAGVMLVLWIIGVGILTQDESVAASISGQCRAADSESRDAAVPGSNLYVFTWICLVSVLDIALCWKASQAMAFAHAGSTQATNRQRATSEGDAEDLNDDDDEEDDEV